LVKQRPIGGIPEEEITAHFDGMPPRYWDRVTEDELVWGVQTVHRFLGKLAASEGGESAAVMDVRHFPQQGCTKVLVCTWDRVGLLTQLAGYISALRLNVVRAQVYTRADNIVLDVFWLCDSKHQHIGDGDRLKQLGFLLEGGLTEPPRFASTWARQSHKHLARAVQPAAVVTFNNLESSDRTVVTIEASERLGLLHDILEVMNENRLNITEALIETVDDMARDIFFVTDEQKNKVTNPHQLETIERAMVAALTS
jgi:[protein-PII] uridylyltransferase